METNPKTAFLSAPRFWAMVFAAISATLVDPGFPTQPWYVTVGKFTGLLAAGFVTVGTIDRVQDKKVEVAKINAETAANSPSVKVSENANVNIDNKTSSSDTASVANVASEK